VGRGRETAGLSAGIPAALLDAADRQLQLDLCGHEHGRVEGPVVAGAVDLLALVDEQAWSVGFEMSTSPTLPRSSTAVTRRLHGLREAAVERARLGAEDGKDRERPRDLGLAECLRDLREGCHDRRSPGARAT
jgi:hypothetical protein